MKKVEIPLLDATRLINHGPCIVVSVGDGDKDNLFSVAWNMPVRKNPPLVAIESSKSHFSYPFIEKTGEFCINVPTASIADKVLAAGRISGASVEDKFSTVGLTRESAARIKAPRVSEAIAHLECRVFKITDIGPSALVIAEVVFAVADEAAFSNGLWQLDTGLELLHHLGADTFCISEKKIMP